LNGTKPPLYRLPEVIKAARAGETVYIPEGEKDVDNLRLHGLTSTTNIAGAGKWHDGLSEALSGAHVVILPDNDKAGRDHAQKVARSVSEYAASVRIVALPGLPEKGDVSDWLMRGHTIAELCELVKQADHYKPEDDNEPGESSGSDGKVPYSILLRTFFQAHGYHFQLNLLDDTVMVNGEPIDDVVKAQIYTRLYDDPDIKNPHGAENVWTAIAAENPCHPIAEYLTGLQWDGTDHIRALSKCFTTSDGDIRYENGSSETPVYVYFKRWLIGAVARVLDQEQNVMLVLSGSQDIGKSYLARWLCSGLPEYFIEGSVSPDDKDHKVQSMTKFIWEVAELDATTRKADVAALKSFVTTEKHTLRKAWGRYPITKPATASYIGTVNDDHGFLSDTTGNRRFMVVTIEKIDWSYTDIEPDQIWAQAVALYRAGEAWRLFPEEKKYQTEKNKEHLVSTALMDYVRMFFDLDMPDECTMSAGEIGHHLRFMDAPIGNTSGTGFAMELSRAMERLGVEKGTRDRGRRCYKGIGKKPIEGSQDESGMKGNSRLGEPSVQPGCNLGAASMQPYSASQSPGATSATFYPNKNINNSSGDGAGAQDTHQNTKKTFHGESASEVAPEGHFEASQSPGATFETGCTEVAPHHKNVSNGHPPSPDCTDITLWQSTMEGALVRMVYKADPRWATSLHKNVYVAIEAIKRGEVHYECE
jgi:predicted P-loop ATPase